jgi:hypothetical protein
MDEVENESIESAVAQPDVSHNQEEAPARETREERNWKEMKRINNELKRKAQLQEEMLERLLKQQPQQVAPQAPVIEEPIIGDDDYLQGAHLKKWQAAAEAKAEAKGRQAAKEETERLLAQHNQSRFRERLKEQYADFDDVVNPETLSLLEEQDPDLAALIVENKDPYKIALQSYKYIKALGIAAQAPTSRRAKEVEKRLEDNAKTVASPQTFNKRPVAQAFQMSKAEMKNVYKEMMGYASQVGGQY